VPILPPAIPFVLAAAGVSSLACAHGGYSPTAWGWGTSAALAVACSTLAVTRRLALAGADRLMLVVFGSLLAWIGFEALRPNAATRAVPELERAALYLAVLWCAFVVLRRATVAAALAGVLAGATFVSCAGLVRVLLRPLATPDVYQGRLLFEPIGYANASGILAAIGAVLALGLAAHARRPTACALAATALVPLLATIVLSRSRGAAVALLVAVALALVLDPARRRLAATAARLLPLALLGAWLASRSSVVDGRVSTSVAARDGRVLGVALVLLAAAQCAVAFRLLPSRAPGRVALRLLAAGIALGGAVGVAAGSTAMLGDRAVYWRAAWADYVAHPLLGAGAGSFEIGWLRYRTLPVAARDAHNLYLEALAELGPVGLALLVAAFAVPFVVAVRHRSPLGATACAAYGAFVVHAALDWDWELPVVTVSALVCGAAVVVAARAGETRAPAPSFRAAVWAAASAAGVALAVAGLVGNSALGRATEASSWTEAERLSVEAARWQPWSARPYVVLGEARLAQGDAAGARRAFARAADLDPQDWRTWYEVARTGDARTRRVAAARIERLNPLVVRRVATPSRPPSACGSGCELRARARRGRLP